MLDLCQFKLLEFMAPQAHVLDLFLIELVVLQVYVLNLYLVVLVEVDVLALCQIFERAGSSLNLNFIQKKFYEFPLLLIFLSLLKSSVHFHE